MADVWDPIVEIRFDYSGTQAKGEEVVSPAYTLAPDEIMEIYRIEIIPPVDTTNKVVQKLRYVTLMIEGKEYESIRLNSIMAPLEDQYNLGTALNLGVPILHRPITGYMPSIVEATCPKVARGQRIAVKTVADEDITQPYSVILKCARVRGSSKLAEVVGSGFSATSFYLDSDLHTKFYLDSDLYTKYVPPITLDTFDELPGGLAQSKPQIFPWVTYTRNKQATTPNMWYDFEYDSYVQYQWQDVSFNLPNKEDAYLVNALGVIPHANCKAIRLYIDGRITNPEFPTTSDHNFFYPPMYYSTDATAAMKKAGPVKLLKPFLFHGVKGGIQIIDNGTSIPANGVEVMVWGTKFVLK